MGDVVGLRPDVVKSLVVAEVAEPLRRVARLLINPALGEAILNPLDAAVLRALGEKLLGAVALDIVGICSIDCRRTRARLGNAQTLFGIALAVYSFHNSVIF